MRILILFGMLIALALNCCASASLFAFTVNRIRERRGTAVGMAAGLAIFYPLAVLQAVAWYIVARAVYLTWMATAG